ncbi:MAG: glycosyltransferase, partial [Acidobacteria bacterium]|nr:glycosyltransferase [Acidobacteriota bacterium]
MPSGKLVSVVIPCYNPTRFLRETLASVRAQTAPPVEIILVNDGTDQPESLRVLESVASEVTRVIEQPNLGLAAARNTGFAVASGDYVLPLDADDHIEPGFLAETAAALEAHPEAGFVYTDYRVFGETRYVERLGDYNLYHLLDRNICIYASLIRRADWEAAGGYDPSMRLGYEDWEFWLRLAERGRYGCHLPRVLFHYRKHGRSLLTVAREHHEELVGKIRACHSQLYSWEGRARIKARWAPAACVLGPEIEVSQTIEDWERLPTVDPRRALEQSNAEAFLVTESGATPDAHSAELCALAVWGGKDVAQLPGGLWAASRRALAGVRELRDVTRQAPLATAPPALPWPRRFERVHRHLVNAELTSLDAWVQHPVRSLGRLIPLGVKERVNRAAGRQVFDLSFYLRFQPQSVATAEAVVTPLRYLPRPSSGRRRIVLFTPHLGPGGAESVLLEVSGALDRQAQELFLIATHSQDARWRQRWEQAVDHVYDLQPLI